MIDLLLADIPPIPAQDSEAIIGAAGQLVTAVLQTAGLYAQGEVLVYFDGALNAVGALLYVVSIVTAICSIALYGNYKNALYFLIGPALFMLMLTETVPGSYTSLQYGARVTPNTGQDQLSFLRIISDSYGEHPRVSWFFKTYDGVVSSVVQQTVGMLLDTENKQDLIAIARERVFSRALMARAMDPGFKKLLSKGLIGNCADATRLSMELSQPRLANAAEGTADAALRDDKRARLDKLLRGDDDTPVRNISLDQDEIEFAVMSGYDREELEQGVGCEFLWTLTRDAAIAAGEAQLNEYSSEAGIDADVPWTEVRDQVLNAISPDNPAQALEVIGAYVVKNSLAETAHSAMTTQIASRAPFVAAKYNGAFGDYANQQAQGGYMKLAYFAGTLPYIQGILLFILAAGFPFFAVFLLMPERMTTFFIWMTLWLWVKSWDIGFALVDVVREVLFPYLARDVNIASTVPDWSDGVPIYQIIYQNDPLANYNIYLTVIGLLRLAVPAVTAHLCMGATNLFDAFKNSLDKNANRFQNLQRNAARRAFATAGNLQMDAMSANNQIQTALQSAANPGETADGTDRFWSGSGAGARHIRGNAAQSAVDFAFSSTANDVLGKIGADTTRRMSYNFTTTRARILQENANRGTEDLSVSNAAEQSIIPGLGSDKINDPSTSLPTVARPQESGDESGGPDGG